METIIMEQSPTDTTNQNGQKANDSPSVTLTLRMIMQGKEVGSIIGKKGDNVKKFREESGAKINISDASCPERIVTVTGSTDAIFKAFTMICKKFEEDLQNGPNSGIPKPPVTIRLIVPASQCGSLIGKGGSKIKEIREVTGASIQVASEMLPNSTERTVTISGTADSITQCIYHICCVMLESPPKGATIPYRPKPAMPPVIFAGGQAFAVQGQYAIPQHQELGTAAVSAAGGQLTKLHQAALQQTFPLLAQQQGLLPGRLDTAGRYNMASLQAMQQYNNVSIPGLSLPHMAAAQARTMNSAQTTTTTASTAAQTHEMTIPNDLIGCIIGRGGSKINEIRQLSGAQIKIANADEGSSDRKVTITGTPETINAAQYYINASMEMHKNSSLDPNSNPTTSLTSQNPPLAAIPLSSLMKPMPLLGLNMGVFDASLSRQKTHAATAATALKMRAAIAGQNGSKKTERNKFAPY